jgi:dihydrofolate reductase
MVGMIFAVSPEGVIGLGNKIPWRHPGDLRRYKRVTMGTTIVMGRKTFESIGKALPGRRNIVVTRTPVDVEGVESTATLEGALELAGGADVWLVGGARIYQEGLKYADVIDVTYVPDHVESPEAVHAPHVDESIFEPGPLLAHEEDEALTRRVYTRRR